MNSRSRKNTGIFLKYGVLLFFLIIIAVFIYRMLSDEDIINNINNIINNDVSIRDDDDYSEMLKDSEHKIIMDWTPRAACSAMVILNIIYYLL